MTQQEPSKLPESWRWVRLSEVVDFLDGKRIPINQEERSKRIAGKPKEELYPYYGANGQVGWIDDYIFNERLVLLAEDGGFFDELGRPVAYIVDGKYWVNNHAHVMRPRSSVIHEFLMYALNTFSLMPYVRGTTRYKLNQGSAKSIGLPLPPVEDQRLIVAKLESILERTRAAKQELSRIPELAKRLRMATLSKAFRGGLTARDSSDIPASGLLEQIRQVRVKEGKQGPRAKVGNGVTPANGESKPPGFEELPQIPDSWAWTRLSEVCHVEMGQSPPGSSYNRQGLGMPLLNGPTEFGETHPEAVQWTSQPTKVCAKEDILICVRGNTTGRMNIADRPYCIGRGLAAIRPVKDSIDRRVIFYFLFYKTSEIMKLTAGSTFPNLPGQELRSLWVPLAPENEQRTLATNIDHAFSNLATACKAAERALEKTKWLEQSILMRAFRGGLVPQDPDDEPASAH